MSQYVPVPQRMVLPPPTPETTVTGARVTYSTAHYYVSTACQHGLHARCRRTCKFCDAPCRCDCDHPDGDAS